MLNRFHAALNTCLISALGAAAAPAMAPESSPMASVALSVLGAGTTEAVADKNINLGCF